MASVQSRGKKGIWHALWRDAQGKKCTRALEVDGNKLAGHKDRKLAQEMADDLERVARAASRGAKAGMMKKLLGEILRKYRSEAQTDMKLSEWITTWLRARKPELGPNSYEEYKYIGEIFQDSLTAAARPNLPIGEIEKEDIVRWRNERHQFVAGATVNKGLRILRGLFQQAKADGVIQENPCDGVNPVKVLKRDTQTPQPYEEHKLSDLLAVCVGENAFWESMVMHAYYTSQRLKDIALMMAGQVDVLQRQVKFISGKTGEIVIAEMPDAYLNWFLARPSHDNPKAWLHPECAEAVLRNKRQSAVTLSSQFARLLWKAGLREEKPKHRKKKDGQGRRGPRKRHPITFHGLRHTLISDLAAGGVPRSLVQDMVGQRSAAVNAAYTHFDSTMKRAAMSKAKDLTKGKGDARQMHFLELLDVKPASK